MTNSLQLGGLYLLMAVMLVLGLLMTRREPAVRMLTYGLAWVGVFASGFILFAFRDNLGLVAQRLRAEAVGSPVTEGKETRIPMAIDGHFWVDAQLNGHDVKFLVDSGATTTTVDRNTARLSGIAVSNGRDQYVRTGNGIIRVASGQADELTIGGIVRRDVALEIADNDDLNVLGMNYLSTLRRWGVEGRWLVLVS
jgi:aspartyl protease family protein